MDEPLPLPPSIRPPKGGLIGRTEELSRLDASWTDSEAGRQRALFLAGEPGIGKSALAGEFAARVHTDGAIVLAARSDEDAEAPYQHVLEALKPYVASRPSAYLNRADIRRVAEMMAVALEWRPVDTPVSTEHRDADRYELFEAVASMLRDVVATAPLLVVLDDLHWATTSTLRLLGHLVRSGGGGWMLLGLYRDTELPAAGPLSDLLADLRGLAGIDRMRLGGLDRAGTSVLINVDLPPDADSADLAAAVYDRSRGNPYFARELARDLAEGEPAEGGLPEGVREVIAHRLARLPSGVESVLTVAAVAGERFSVHLLEELRPEGVLDGLEQAMRAKLIEEVPGDAMAFMFSHGLVRETLYSQISSGRRARLHHQIAEALEALPDRDGSVDAIAYHYSKAAPIGDPAKAADYALLVARSALARFAHEHAITALERGLAALEAGRQVDLVRRADLLIELITARLDAGDADGVRADVVRAADDARSTGSVAQLARTAVASLDLRRWDMHDPLPTALLQEALAALGDTSPGLRAQVLGQLAWDVMGAGDGSGRDIAEATEMATEALALAREVGDPKGILYALDALSFALVATDRIDERLALADEAADLGGPVWSVQRAALRFATGDLIGFEADVDALEEFADKERAWYERFMAAGLRAQHALAVGDLVRAEALAADVLAYGRGSYEAIGVNGGIMMAIRREEDRLGDVVESLARLGAEPSTYILAMQALHAVSESAEEARRHLATLDRSRLGRVTSHASIVGAGMLAEVCAALPEPDLARPLYNMLRPLQGQLCMAGAGVCLGAVDRLLAMLAAIESRWDDAQGHFERALELEGRIGASAFVARTQLWYARMLLARAGPDDASAAMRLVAAASEAADRMNLAELRRRLAELHE